MEDKLRSALQNEYECTKELARINENTCKDCAKIAAYAETLEDSFHGDNITLFFQFVLAYELISVKNESKQRLPLNDNRINRAASLLTQYILDGDKMRFKIIAILMTSLSLVDPEGLTFVCPTKICKEDIFRSDHPCEFTNIDDKGMCLCRGDCPVIQRKEGTCNKIECTSTASSKWPFWVYMIISTISGSAASYVFSKRYEHALDSFQQSVTQKIIQEYNQGMVC